MPKHQNEELIFLWRVSLRTRAEGQWNRLKVGRWKVREPPQFSSRCYFCSREICFPCTGAFSESSHGAPEKLHPGSGKLEYRTCSRSSRRDSDVDTSVVGYLKSCVRDELFPSFLIILWRRAINASIRLLDLSSAGWMQGFKPAIVLKLCSYFAPLSWFIWPCAAEVKDNLI